MLCKYYKLWYSLYANTVSHINHYWCSINILVDFRFMYLNKIQIYTLRYTCYPTFLTRCV